MRTIKFRGFSTDSNQWVYGFYREYQVYKSCGKCLDHINYFIDLVGGGSEFVKPATVGQFTGLLDKNGTEIYEGDIIKYSDEWNTEYIVKVFFENGCFLTDAEIEDCDKAALGYLVTYLDVGVNGSQVEVVGNIHDNP